LLRAHAKKVHISPFFGGITVISVMKTQDKNALPAFGLSLERGQILKNLQDRLRPR